MAKRIVTQQSMPGLEQPKAAPKERSDAQRVVMAYARGWKSVRGTQPPKPLIGQVARAGKRMLEEGRVASVVIDAAERCGRKGYGATGLSKEVGGLEAARAAYDAAASLGEANQRGL